MEEGTHRNKGSNPSIIITSMTPFFPFRSWSRRLTREALTMELGIAIVSGYGSVVYLTVQCATLFSIYYTVFFLFHFSLFLLFVWELKSVDCKTRGKRNTLDNSCDKKAFLPFNANSFVKSRLLKKIGRSVK